MPSSDSRDYELIDRLAEEFAQRFRNGERPSLQEYCDRYPHIADDLRDMLPALAEVEQVKDEVEVPPADTTPALHQVGEYQILREVGRGGMGVVYEAEDTRLGRRVALKVLASGKAGHALERFKREAKAAARLHHTNIVPVFGVGDHDGLPYYVMQFIQGLGLDEVMEEVKRLQALSGAAVPPSAVSARPRKDVSAAAVARSLVTGTFEPPAPAGFDDTRTHAPDPADSGRADSGRADSGRADSGRADSGRADSGRADSGRAPRVSGGVESTPADPPSSSAISLPGQSQLSGRKLTYWQSVAQIGLQVAEALAYAHQQGVLHRDIKPSNLLLDLHGVVWVTDFGLAKADDQEDLTHTGDVLGTLRYMPPEAFEGTSEPRSDVYSLGLSLYELLALRPAFDERKREQLVKQVTTTDPPRLGTVSRAIPRDLQTIIHKAIEKDPDHRYRSAADLAADLRRFLADQPILARRISPTERFARWCKRNPTVAGLSAAVFLLLVAGVLTASVLAVQIEKKARAAAEEADRATAEADAARQARDAEAAERRRTLRLLGEEHVRRGATLQAAGDLSGAALHYAEALRLDPDDPGRAADHRVRLTATLAAAPRPRQVWFHDAPVVTTAVAPDGQTVAVGCVDGSVHLWDVASGRRVRDAFRLTFPVGWVAFAADGKKLWAAGTSASAPGPDDPPSDTRLWDLGTGRELLRLQQATALLRTELDVGPGWVEAKTGPTLEFRDLDTAEPLGPAIPVPFDPEQPTAVRYNRYHSLPAGRVAVVTLVGTVRRAEAQLWDVRTGKPVGQPIRCRNGAAVFIGPDQESLAVAAQDGGLQWVDAATGTPGAMYHPPRRQLVNGLDISPDGRRALAFLISFSGGTPQRTLRPYGQMLDARTAGPVEAEFLLDPEATLAARRLLVLNRDGSRFALIAAARQIDLIGADGTSVPTPPTHPAGVRDIGFSPDGGYLLGVGTDNAVRVWKAFDGQPATPLLPHPDRVRQARFTPDGSHVLTAAGAGVWLWPMDRQRPGRVVPAFTGPVRNRRQISADGRRVLETSTGIGTERASTAAVRDAATGQVLAGPVKLPVVDRGAGPSAVTAVGTWLARFRPDGRAALFEYVSPSSFPSGQPGENEAPPARVAPLLWDCDSGTLRPLPVGGNDRLPGGDFSPDGRFVQMVSEVDANLTCRLWDARTGEPVGSPVSFWPATGKAGDSEFRIPDYRSAVAWRTDSARLAAVESADGNLRLRVCDPHTGQNLVVAPLGVPAPRRTAVEFASTGDTVMTVVLPLRRSNRFIDPYEPYEQVRLWDARTGDPLTPALAGDRFGGALLRAVLAPAGDRLALVVRPRGAPAGVTGFGADGRLSPGSAAVVHLWDVAAGRVLAAPLIHDRGVTDLQFHPAGDRLLTAATAGPARLWSAVTGELLQEVAGPDAPTQIRFSADGRRAVVTTLTSGPPFGSTPSWAQVVDVQTGQPLTPVLDLASAPLIGSSARARDSNWPMSAAADRLWIARPDGTEGLYELGAEARPAADLRALVELLSGRQVNSAGLVQGLGPARFRDAWAAGRGRLVADGVDPPVEGLAWHRRHVPSTGRPPGPGGFPRLDGAAGFLTGQVVWHVDRLVAAEPDNAGLRTRRSQLLLEQGRFVAAEADLTRALELDPKPTSTMYFNRGEARAAQGKWAEAEADLLAALGTVPEPTGQPFFPQPFPASLRINLALVRLARGDTAGYQAECRHLLPVVSKRPKEGVVRPTDRANGIWPVLLTEAVSPALADLDPLLLASPTAGRSPFLHVAGVLYRQGKYAEVVERLGPRPTRPADWYLRAMAEHRLGQPEAARASLAAGRQREAEPDFEDVQDPSPRGRSVAGWQIDLANQVLRKEAEQLIEGKK